MFDTNNGAAGQTASGTRGGASPLAPHDTSYREVSTPPRDLDAERAVLACVLYGKVLPSTLDLTGADFYQPDHDALWNVLEAMEQAGETLDPIVASDRLSASVERLADPALVPSLAGGSEIPDNAGSYAGMVRDASRRRHAMAFVRQAEQRLAQGEDPAEVLDTGALEKFIPDHRSAGPRRARITWASAIEPEPVVWAWSDGGDGRIPSGSLSIAAGREGTGKSSFGMWLAARITTGTLPGSLHGTPRTVFYCAVEDSWKYTLAPRLIAAGADLNRIGRFDVISDRDETLTLCLPADNELLEDAIVEHDAALVIVDPLMSAIDGRIDTHVERKTRSALDPLAQMADRTGAVILGIAHFNKGNGTDAASLITGSGAFKNVPRSVFGFAKPEDDSDRVMTQVKNSLGKDTLPSLAYRIETAEVKTPKGPAFTGLFKFTGQSDMSVSDILRESHGDAQPDGEDRNEAQAFILDCLADSGGEHPASDVLKAGHAAGFSDNELKNARKRCRHPRIVSRKAGMGGGWVWAIDDEGVTKESKVSPLGNVTPSTPSVTPSQKPEQPSSTETVAQVLPLVPTVCPHCHRKPRPGRADCNYCGHSLEVAS